MAFPKIEGSKTMPLGFGSFLLFVCLTTGTIAGPKEDVSATTTKWIEAIGENNTDKVVALYAEMVSCGARVPQRCDRTQPQSAATLRVSSKPYLASASGINWSACMATPPSILAITR